MSKIGGGPNRKRGFRKVTSIGNSKKKNVRDNSKRGSRQRKGR